MVLQCLSGLIRVVFKARLILCLLLQISSAEIFLIGAIAKAIAATSTYPLQTVQTILRVKTNLEDMFLLLYRSDR